MKWIKFILIVSFLLLRQAICADTCTSLMCLLPYTHCHSERTLEYNPIRESYILELDDRELDSKDSHNIILKSNIRRDDNITVPSIIASVVSNSEQIVITLFCSTNFIITNNRHAIGSHDKNFLVSYSEYYNGNDKVKHDGSLIFGNMLRAQSITMNALSIRFEEQVSVKKGLQLTVRKNLEFLVPYVAPSKTEIDKEGGLTLWSTPVLPSEGNLSLKETLLDLKLSKSLVEYRNILKEILKNIIKEGDGLIKQRVLLEKILSSDIIDEDALRLALRQCGGKKDLIADFLVQKVFQEEKQFQYINTKLSEGNKGNKGNSRGQGFDGLFVKDEKIILVEVKFVGKENDGTPQPKKININGIDWRQLSTPYNKKVLKDMKIYSHNHPSSDVRKATDLIMSKQEFIELYLIALNVKDLRLDWYDVGTFLNSNFN